ncbi:MAG: glycosyltransferase [Desulfitobacterium sp.]
MRIPHVLVECIEKIPSVIVGVLVPLQSLQDKELLQVRFIKTIEITADDLAWCDILVCVRGCEPIDFCVVQAAKKAGRKIIYFLDDDLLDIPQDVSCSPYFNDRFIRKNIINLMELSDILWAVNPNIIRKYGHFFEKSCLADACTCEIKELQVRPDFPVKFIYAGSIDHENIVREKLSSNIKRIIEEYGDKVEFTFIGANPHLSDLSQVKYIPYIEDYSEYKKLMNESGFHISFAIVRTTPFYKHKYFNKFLEYASIGAIGIYTNTEPYTFIIENEVNGILCDDNNDKWYDAMKFLIENPKKRNEMSKEAYRLLCERFTPESVGEKLNVLMPELITFNAPEILAQRININQKSVIMRFYFHRVRMLFVQYGVIALIILPVKVIKMILRL